MKKIAIILLLTLICFSACSSNSSVQQEASTNESSEISYSNETEKNKTDLIEQTSSKKNIEDIGGAELTTRKYRVRYYTVPYQFILIVGEDTFNEWEKQFITENPDDTNEMVIKKFVQYFDISREDFERANLEFAKALAIDPDYKLFMNPKDYADQEVDEIYNVDIIYSFDDETINEYYLSHEYAFGLRVEYEDALAAGAYQTQTTDWIDIDQMEAEINAKYGEPEVTEATTVIDKA